MEMAPTVLTKTHTTESYTYASPETDALQEENITSDDEDPLHTLEEVFHGPSVSATEHEGVSTEYSIESTEEVNDYGFALATALKQQLATEAFHLTGIQQFEDDSPATATTTEEVLIAPPPVSPLYQATEEQISIASNEAQRTLIWEEEQVINPATTEETLPVVVPIRIQEETITPAYISPARQSEDFSVAVIRQDIPTQLTDEKGKSTQTQTERSAGQPRIESTPPARVHTTEPSQPQKAMPLSPDVVTVLSTTEKLVFQSIAAEPEVVVRYQEQPGPEREVTCLSEVMIERQVEVECDHDENPEDPETEVEYVERLIRQVDVETHHETTYVEKTELVQVDPVTNEKVVYLHGPNQTASNIPSVPAMVCEKREADSPVHKAHEVNAIQRPSSPEETIKHLIKTVEELEESILVTDAATHENVRRLVKGIQRLQNLASGLYHELGRRAVSTASLAA